jgi:hypothetical protein
MADETVRIANLRGNGRLATPLACKIGDYIYGKSVLKRSITFYRYGSASNSGFIDVFSQFIMHFTSREIQLCFHGSVLRYRVGGRLSNNQRYISDLWLEAADHMLILPPVMAAIVAILGDNDSNILNNMALLVIDMRDGARLVQIGFIGAGDNLETVGADFCKLVGESLCRHQNVPITDFSVSTALSELMPRIEDPMLMTPAVCAMALLLSCTPTYLIEELRGNPPFDESAVCVFGERILSFFDGLYFDTTDEMVRRPF